MLDDLARKILGFLQEDGRVSTAEIARRIDLTQSAVHERIRKMEEAGVIRGYTATIDPAAVGAALVAFVLVRTPGHRQAVDAGMRLAELPEVQEVHHVAGEDGVLIKLKVADPAALWAWVRERLDDVRSLDGTRTMIVLETVKESSALPL